jgi:hypothetical protein
MDRSTGTRWVVVALAVLAVVALLAFARNDAGVDGRAPDPEDAVAVLVDDGGPDGD